MNPVVPNTIKDAIRQLEQLVTIPVAHTALITYNTANNWYLFRVYCSRCRRSVDVTRPEVQPWWSHHLVHFHLVPPDQVPRVEIWVPSNGGMMRTHVEYA